MHSHAMPETPEQQLAGFLAKFTPAMAKRIRECRAAMRRRFPTAFELVYDNYNFFVIGYSPTERPSDAVYSLAAYAKGVALNFGYGASLPDPHGILQGSGSRNRHVRLEEGAASLERPEIAELIDAAEAIADPPFPATGKGKLIIRAISPKQRPRR